MKNFRLKLLAPKAKSYFVKVKSKLKLKIKINEVYLTPLAIILAGLMISASILIGEGILFSGLKKAGQTATLIPQAAVSPQPAPGNPVNVEPLRADDHTRGERTARILLIEYSDLECPFCKRFHPTAKQIVDSYGGQVAWVYRHFPLDQIHSKADKEAEAVECAGELGGNDAFWQLTDKIFEVTPSNNGLDLATLPNLAAQIGQDLNQFKNCLDSGKWAARVEADYQSGIKAGVTGTPGNILLDTKSGQTRLIPGALPYDSFKEAIDSLLQ